MVTDREMERTLESFLTRFGNVVREGLEKIAAETRASFRECLAAEAAETRALLREGLAEIARALRADAAGRETAGHVLPKNDIPPIEEKEDRVSAENKAESKVDSGNDLREAAGQSPQTHGEAAAADASGQSLPSSAGQAAGEGAGQSSQTPMEEDATEGPNKSPSTHDDEAAVLANILAVPLPSQASTALGSPVEGPYASNQAGEEMDSEQPPAPSAVAQVPVGNEETEVDLFGDISDLDDVMDVTPMVADVSDVLGSLLVFGRTGNSGNSSASAPPIDAEKAEGDVELSSACSGDMEIDQDYPEARAVASDVPPESPPARPADPSGSGCPRRKRPHANDDGPDLSDPSSESSSGSGSSSSSSSSSSSESEDEDEGDGQARAAANLESCRMAAYEKKRAVFKALFGNDEASSPVETKSRRAARPPRPRQSPPRRSTRNRCQTVSLVDKEDEEEGGKSRELLKDAERFQRVFRKDRRLQACARDEDYEMYSSCIDVYIYARDLARLRAGVPRAVTDGPVFRLAVHPSVDPVFAAAADKQGTVAFWRLDDDSYSSGSAPNVYAFDRLLRKDAHVTWMGFHPGVPARMLATTRDATIQVFDVERGKFVEQSEYCGKKDELFFAADFESPETLVVGADNGLVYVLDMRVESGGRLPVLRIDLKDRKEAHDYFQIRSVSVNTSQSHLLAVSGAWPHDEGTINSKPGYMLDTRNLNFVSVGNDVADVRFSASGRFLAARRAAPRNRVDVFHAGALWACGEMSDEHADDCYGTGGVVNRDYLLASIPHHRELPDDDVFPGCWAGGDGEECFLVGDGGDNDDEDEEEEGQEMVIKAYSPAGEELMPDPLDYGRALASASASARRGPVPSRLPTRAATRRSRSSQMADEERRPPPRCHLLHSHRDGNVLLAAVGNRLVCFRP